MGHSVFSESGARQFSDTWQKKPKVAKLERVEQSTRGKKGATTFFGFPNKQPDNFTCL